jgi:molecular chaperone Hsp33
MDNLIRGITENKQIRFIAVESTGVVESALKIHHLDPTATVIIGRVLSGTLMMAGDLKSRDNLLTVKIESDGIINQVLATADKSGNVKGFLHGEINNSEFNNDTKLSLKATLGKGQLVVIKDLGLKMPHIGRVELKYGTIARDLAYYYAASEQINSSVGLGVLLNENNTVRQAGGFIIQLMPQASELTISRLENNLHKFPNFTDVLDMGYSVEDIIREYLLKGLGPVILEEIAVQYKCDCSKAKFKAGLALLSKEDLQNIFEEGHNITVNCHFCNSDYRFSVDEIMEILKSKK